MTAGDKPSHPKDVIEEAIGSLSTLFESLGSRTICWRLVDAAVVVLKEALKVAPRRQSGTFGVELEATKLLARAARFAEKHPDRLAGAYAIDEESGAVSADGRRHGGGQT